MASNVELIKKIAAISDTAETEGLTNAQLAALLKTLTEAAAETTAAETTKRAAGWYVADGAKSITTKRGIRCAGMSVDPANVAGGEVTLARLVAKGVLVREEG